MSYRVTWLLKRRDGMYLADWWKSGEVIGELSMAHRFPSATFARQVRKASGFAAEYVVVRRTLRGGDTLRVHKLNKQMLATFDDLTRECPQLRECLAWGLESAMLQLRIDIRQREWEGKQRAA